MCKIMRNTLYVCKLRLVLRCFWICIASAEANPTASNSKFGSGLVGLASADENPNETYNK